MDNIPVVNNLKFDSVEYRQSMSKIYAFVTCIDVQKNGKGTNKKRYWGEVASFNDAEELLNVISYGAKWDHLP